MAPPPLCTSYRGSTTLCQLFRAAVREHRDRALLGKRAILPDGELPRSLLQRVMTQGCRQQ
jgi:hypothetical protein